MAYKSRHRVCAGFQIVRKSVPSRWTGAVQKHVFLKLSLWAA